MSSTLVLGLLAAFLATTLAAALRRAPTRTRCPACGAATIAVQPEAWLLKRMPDVRPRWCPACSWQGWGRNGAEWTPGHPTAHDSGFHWGDDRLPENWGFRFANQPHTATSAEPPHHPSGFRFSRPPVNPRKAHPSGFSWADGGRAALEAAADAEAADAAGAAGASGASAEPRGFQWAPPPTERGARFAWGRREGRHEPPPRGFNWKDVG